MNLDTLLGLANNAALLVALSILYDLMPLHQTRRSRLFEILSGILAGLIGIVIMLTPWRFSEGVIFDTRSILISITALYFGQLPVIIAAAMTAALRLFQGGSGAYTGVIVILTSAIIGLIWRHHLAAKNKTPKWYELYGFGVIVHLNMLAMMLTLPRATAFDVLRQISLPVMLIYPLGTVLLGMLFTHRDQRLQAEKNLKESEATFAAAFHSSPLLMSITRMADGQILDVNQTFATVTGYSREELLFQSPINLNMWADLAARDEMLHRLTTEGIVRGLPIDIRTRSGEIRHLSFSSAPITIRSKPCLISAAIDITEQKKAEKALEDSQALLNQSQAIAHVGSWALDLETKRLTWSDEVYRIFGLEPQELEATYEAFLSSVHPDDRAAVDAAYFSSVAERGDTYEIEHRIIRQHSGEIRFVHERCKHIKDASGKIIRSIGMVQDITERKRAEEQIAKQLQTLSALYSYAQKLAESLDTQTVAQETVRLCVETFGVCLAWLGKAEADGRVTIIAQFPEDHPYPRQITLRWDDTPEGQGPTGRAIRTGKPQFTRDIAHELHPPWRDRLLAHGFACSAAFPLISRGHTFGTLNLYSDTPNFFTPDQEGIFQSLAFQAAASLENARLFETERYQRELSEKLRRALQAGASLSAILDFELVLDHLLENLAQVVPFEGGNIMFIAPETGKVHIARLRGYEHLGQKAREGILKLNFEIATTENLRWMYEHKQPLVIPDIENYPAWIRVKESEFTRSWAGAPIIINGKVIAFFSLDSTIPNFFTQEHALLLQSFTGQASLALENARLFEETNRRLRHIQALRHIDTSITTESDIHVTFNVALEEITQQLGVDAACLLIFNPQTQTLDYAAGRGFRTQALQHTRLHPGEGYAGKAIQEHRPIYIQDLRRDHSHFARSPHFASEEFASCIDVPLIAKGKIKGVLEIFHRSPLQPNEEWNDFLETLAGQTAIAIDNAELYHDLEQTNRALLQAYDATIEGWSRAMDLRDQETEHHTRRVTEMTLKLAEAAGVTDEELRHIKRGAILHDIGKIGVPDHILLKPGKLTPEEWVIMQKHPQLAFDLLSPVEYLRPALDIPHYHHEKWDGTGYPCGLKGEEIPLAARLFAIVDVWDALTSDRPYRQAWTREKALEYILDQSGKHFDPKVVELFIKIIPQIP